VGDRSLNLQVWDTSGQERYKAIAPSFIKKAEGVVMAYDVTDRQSFEHVGSWMSQLENHGEKNVSIVLVGNKIDMKDRAVEYIEGKKLAEHHGIMFFEASAKNNINIEEAFMALGKEIVRKQAGDEPEVDSFLTKSHKLNNKRKGSHDEPERSGGCC